ncbi:MAG TPA: metalloregulator ArsR/SmtB family transcription factor [Vicinamibacteria bacterium]|nr:metalloregulator ArsR/SmtB family transcription factor [Vicinamibacteria bacterium]
MGAEQRTELEPVWRALANPLRRRILDILADGPCTTGELAERFPEHSRFAVMQHIRVLEAGHLVVHRRMGRKRFNYLNPIPIQEIYHRWVSRYQRPWAEALLALKGELEAEQQSSKTREERGKTGKTRR